MPGRRSSLLLASALLTLAALPSGAEPPPAKDWEVELLGYAWLPAIDGSIERPNGHTEHFSMGAIDLLEDLELGAMGRVNVRWRRWLLLVDGLWTKLDQDERLQRNRLRIDADVEFQMALAQALAGYRVFSRPGGLFGPVSAGDTRVFGADLVAGANYTWLDTEVRLDRAAIGPLPPRERRLETSNDWFAPAVGLRLQNDFTSRIRLETLATAGGFGVGEAPDLSWQVTTLLSFRFTDHWLVSAGHRVYAADDDDLDVRLHGAMLGVGYRF